MKTTSIRYGKPGSIEIIELDVADPGPGEIQVQGAACGICAWDLYTFKNGADAPSAAPPGHEGMGYVTKIGAEVTGFEEGDRVVGRGFAGAYNMNANAVHRIPSDSELADEHWIVEPVSCVVTGLDHCRLRPADRVAVVGCGYMGLMILQGLAHSFAEQVIAVDVNPQKLKLAEDLGATACFNPAECENEDLVQELSALDFDVVIDASGAQACLDLSTKIVRRGGLLNLFGWNHGVAQFSGDLWHLKGITVVNSAPGSKLRDTFPPAIRLLHKGIIDLKPLVTHVVTLDEYESLLKQVVNGDQSYVKGVVRLNADSE
ncbi:MAG: zinc-binding dehydrogenase [Planctomycetota bacterium]|jgi:threonine dehydrogenase-like Zn-dependent dehydrogenase|nr:zinc-binding dehydrogenase [Planctomycetota bacterium]MDP7254186.1 zinc-binding dehydrogenase [Planctomycetota bacterium]